MVARGLRKTNEYVTAREMEFSHAAFWLPLGCMNKNTLIAIVNKVGEVLEVEHSQSGEYWGKFARVRVKLHISKPLRWGVLMKMNGSEDELWIPLRYEKLLVFCYFCGLIGHSHKGCVDEQRLLL